MLLRDQIYSRRRERESYWEAKTGLEQVNGFLVEAAEEAVAVIRRMVMLRSSLCMSKALSTSVQYCAKVLSHLSFLV